MNQNLGVSELANLVVADRFVAQQGGDVIDCLIGFLADGFLHLHLKNQVRAALQIQS